MTITKFDDTLGMICDYCQAYQTFEGAEDYSSVHAMAKDKGYITRKIDDNWYNFCCETCYHEFLKAQESKLRQYKEDAVNPEKNPDWKCATFVTELNYIESPALKTVAQRLLNATPDYFFTVAASSTGKYHPQYAQGSGGLVRHTQAAVRIAMELLRLDMYAHLRQAKDFIVIALLLHDSWKHGPIQEDGSYNEYTTFTHPKVAADFVRNSALLNPEALNYIAALMETHMGQWTTNYRTGISELEVPNSEEQKFIHLCDYLASRKCLEFNNYGPFEGY